MSLRKMRSDAELTEWKSADCAPYAGAIARFYRHYQRQSSADLREDALDGGIPPMADVFNGEGTNIGMVGQSGQIYARGRPSVSSSTAR